MITALPTGRQGLRIPILPDEVRGPDRLWAHYLVERELADRLRRASPSERRQLYSVVYDELFRRVPDHPRNRPREAARDGGLKNDLKFLYRFLGPETVFMEIGPGDCALSRHVAGMVKRVYAVDVSERIMRGPPGPRNFEPILSDGTSIPVPEGGVDVAFSDQLMEHLHPDDAEEQLRNIHRGLKPGGVYICLTPNRLYGPRDISGYFEDVAKGMHMREYTGGELRRLFRQVGFSRVRFYAGARGLYVRVPSWLALAAEAVLDALPPRLRRRLADLRPMRALLGLRVCATKPV